MIRIDFGDETQLACWAYEKRLFVKKVALGT